MGLLPSQAVGSPGLYLSRAAEARPLPPLEREEAWVQCPCEREGARVSCSGERREASPNTSNLLFDEVIAKFSTLREYSLGVMQLLVN